MPVCGPSLFNKDNKYIKVGNGEFLAIDGSNIMERLVLSDLRIPYSQILKGRIILKPGEENYLLNYLGLGDNVTFLLIKATYDSNSLEEDNYITYKPYNNIEFLSSFSKMIVLNGNSTNRIPQMFLTNPNPNYKVELDLMIAIIDDETSFYNYKPVVYFNDIVTLDTTEYTEPFNTSMGDNFGATVSTSTYGDPIDKTTVLNLIIDEVRDSNGVIITPDDSEYLIYDDNSSEVTSLSIGTYSLKFNITDTLGYSVDPVDEVQIIVT